MTAPIKAGMTDQTSSNIARDGAPKRPQTSFPTHYGMTDQTEMSKIGPGKNPGVGPDASSPDVLGGAPKIVSTEFPVTFGMKGQNSNEHGRKVLGEAVS